MTVARAHNPIKRVAPFHMTLAPWIAINQFILSHAFVNNLAMISAGARHPRPATRRTAPSTGPPLPTWDPGPSKISEGCDVMGGEGGGGGATRAPMPGPPPKACKRHLSNANCGPEFRACRLLFCVAAPCVPEGRKELRGPGASRWPSTRPDSGGHPGRTDRLQCIRAR